MCDLDTKNTCKKCEEYGICPFSLGELDEDEEIISTEEKLKLELSIYFPPSTIQIIMDCVKDVMGDFMIEKESDPQ